MGERNYRLTLAYDGTRYRGWQRLAQADTTIQGKLEAVLPCTSTGTSKMPDSTASSFPCIVVSACARRCQPR